MNSIAPDWKRQPVTAEQIVEAEMELEKIAERIRVKRKEHQQ